MAGSTNYCDNVWNNPDGSGNCEPTQPVYQGTPLASTVQMPPAIAAVPAQVPAADVTPLIWIGAAVAAWWLFSSKGR